jgi:uncharacterized protein YdhG (YjbR/CyaY superfamily)
MATAAGRSTGAGAADVDRYLAALDEPQRDTLTRLRHTLRTLLPHADEGLKYAMPAFALGGKGVAGYAAFANHCSYFPMSGAVLEAAGAAVSAYPVSKGGLQFPIDRTPPVGLLRRLVKLRLAEISAVDNGRRIEYFGDGRRKASGTMKDGELHGRWTWYRSDGSVSRTGRFDRGTRTGTWETWDRDGDVVKTTTF